MDLHTAHILTAATNAFYRSNAASFSLTRQRPWPGWRRVMDDIGMDARTNLRALDVACGNLRFEKFLAETWPEAAFDFLAIDDCEALLPEKRDASFERRDIVGALLDEQNLVIGKPVSFDLAVCFGFMHHVPTFDARRLLLESLVEAIRPDGIVAISFWRFMRSEKLAAKARASTPVGLEQLGLSAHDLDRNDYLLGWQETQGSWRYCHHFEDDEIDRLTNGLPARIVDRFRSDGRTDDLNEYLVLQRFD